MKRAIIAVFLQAVACHAITVSNIVAQVSVNSYSNFHAGLFVADGNSRGFTGGESPRVPAFQHDLARDFIFSSFQSMGYDTWLDPFSFTHSSGYTYSNCNNVVAIKWGAGGTNVFIIGAHYDSVDIGQTHGVTVTNACPGADDNASGTAAILEAAKAMKDYVFRDTIVIIAFDAEEKDYKGSIHFVNQHITDVAGETNATTFLKSTIKAMVNLDTIAYDDTNSPPYVVIGRVAQMTPVSLALSDAVSNYTTLIPYNDPDYDLSDHKVFDAAGIDSVHLIEFDYDDYFDEAGINPHIHSDRDSVDTPGYISYSYATEITRAVVGAVCEYAGIIPPASLEVSMKGGTIIELSWLATPDESYSLYGADTLMQTNPWTFIQFFAPTNATTEYSIQLDLGTVTQTFFKVESLEPLP